MTPRAMSLALLSSILLTRPCQGTDFPNSKNWHSRKLGDSGIWEIGGIFSEAVGKEMLELVRTAMPPAGSDISSKNYRSHNFTNQLNFAMDGEYFSHPVTEKWSQDMAHAFESEKNNEQFGFELDRDHEMIQVRWNSFWVYNAGASCNPHIDDQKVLKAKKANERYLGVLTLKLVDDPNGGAFQTWEGPLGSSEGEW